MGVQNSQDCSADSSADQSSAKPVKDIRMMSFAEIEAYEPNPHAVTTLFQREPYLLKPVADEEVIPQNDEIPIEALTPEDMDLPIGFV